MFEKSICKIIKYEHLIVDFYFLLAFCFINVFNERRFKFFDEDFFFSLSNTLLLMYHALLRSVSTIEAVSWQGLYWVVCHCVPSVVIL